jgi:hypothetical protein
MQSYKGYFIEGDALIVHPFSPDWYVGGSVLVAGHHGGYRLAWVLVQSKMSSQLSPRRR